MPRGDGTGPTGMGPMTGRAAGYCAGTAMPGYANAAGGGFARGRGGFGRGMGRGMGFGARAQAPVVVPVPPADELTMLKRQADALDQQTQQIRRRISELENADPQ